VLPTGGSGPLPTCLHKATKAQRSMCHQLIILNKVDLLFQPCHHSCVLFDARPVGGVRLLSEVWRAGGDPRKWPQFWRLLS
jgi:hypothetical protein